MVQYPGELDQTFGAVSDATRRGILQRLGRGDASISALAADFAMRLTGGRGQVDRTVPGVAGCPAPSLRMPSLRKLVAFNNMTLDGYFADSKGGIGWAHRDSNDAEYNAFVADNAKAGDTLVLGRITYALMAGYWATPLASQNDPVAAARMNDLTKLVFSRTQSEVSWRNTTLVKGDLAAEVRTLKQASGKDMAILGSGSIVAQLAQQGLIDEFQLMVNPVVLGQGRTMFEGVKEKLNLRLTSTRSFGNGNILLCYPPTG